MKPVIGISMDVAVVAGSLRTRAECSLAYADAVDRAGGVPMYLAPVVSAIPDQLRVVDAVVLTGGDDPRTEAFGVPTHPAATPLHARRQEYELALLAALEGSAHAVLGVCLGMQLMALAAGGELDQHLPDTLREGARAHRADGGAGAHALTLDEAAAGVLGLSDAATGEVCSHHHQAVRHAGHLHVLARHADGTIEAIGQRGARYFAGVQWHPERTSDPALGQGIIAALVRAARTPRV